MFESSIAARGNRARSLGAYSRAEGRPVRFAFITWPAIVFLGATVAAATCMMGDCPLRAKITARESRVGHAGTVRSIAYRSDGAILGSVGADESILIWGLFRRIERPFRPEASKQVRAAAFGPDDRLLAVANVTGPVAVCDLPGGLTRTLLDPAAATTGAACLAFSPNGTTLVVGQQDGRISLWDAAELSQMASLPGHLEFVASLAFSQDGSTLATSGGDRTVRIWEMPAGRERLLIESPTRTFCALSVSPDGRLLALGDQVNPVVQIWNLSSGVQEACLRGPSGAVVALAINPAGTTLAAADMKGSVTFWDLATLEPNPRRLSHNGVRTLAFAPDGRGLATGGFDGTIHIWDFPIVAR
jgi:WD40 repeat protein